MGRKYLAGERRSAESVAVDESTIWFVREVPLHQEDKRRAFPFPSRRRNRARYFYCTPRDSRRSAHCSRRAMIPWGKAQSWISLVPILAAIPQSCGNLSRLAARPSTGASAITTSRLASPNLWTRFVCVAQFVYTPFMRRIWGSFSLPYFYDRFDDSTWRRGSPGVDGPWVSRDSRIIIEM